MEGPDLIQTSSKKSRVLFRIRTISTKPRDINQVTVHNTVSVNEFRCTTESVNNFGEINIRFSTNNENNIPYKKTSKWNKIKIQNSLFQLSNLLLLLPNQIFQFFFSFHSQQESSSKDFNMLIQSSDNQYQIWKKQNNNDSSAFIHHLHNNVNYIQWYIKQEKNKWPIHWNKFK